MAEMVVLSLVMVVAHGALWRCVPDRFGPGGAVAVAVAVVMHKRRDGPRP